MTNRTSHIINYRNKHLYSVAVIVLYIFLFSLLSTNHCNAQQLPYYTQFKANSTMLNPAFIGTKRLIDIRLNSRIQWMGMEDAPVTNGVYLNNRFAGGTMGLGVGYYLDQTGPTKRSAFSGAYSYHASFEDVELSLGFAGQMFTYIVDGRKLRLHVPYDNAFNLAGVQKKTVFDGSLGALFYNDRFHLGLSVLNFREPDIIYIPASADTFNNSKLHIVPHIYSSIGYNWSGDPDWIWENSLMVVYAQNNPLTIDYNLRLHYRQKVFGGAAIRLHDAVALQFGFTFNVDFQVSYSYDLITSKLGSYQSGTHEIMVVWSSNLGQKEKRKYGGGRFKRQKYGFMF